MSEPSDSFEGEPWGGSEADWNQIGTWDDYYRELYAESDPWRRDHVIHRDIRQLIELLSYTGLLSPAGRRCSILDAGCGVSLIPQILAYWGFEVTAIDACARAIESIAHQEPTESDLARLIWILDPCPDQPNTFMVVKDPARSLERLRNYRIAGGSAKYVVCDWFSSDLPPASFQAIYCRNALRLSLKPYWRRSLQRFHELLEPGGILLLENVNAIGIYHEVKDLLAEVGFLPFDPSNQPSPTDRFYHDVWPTG